MKWEPVEVPQSGEMQWEDVEPVASGPVRAAQAVPGALQSVYDVAGVVGGMLGSGYAAAEQWVRRPSTPDVVGKDAKGKPIYAAKRPEQKFGDWILSGMQDIQESAENTNIASKLPGAEQRRKTPGYEASQTVLNAAQQGFGNISAAAAFAATGDAEFAADIGQRMEAGSDIAGLLLLQGKPKAKVGSQAWYRELHDSFKSNQNQIAASRDIQKRQQQYAKEQNITRLQWEDVVAEESRKALPERQEALLNDPAHLGLDEAWAETLREVDEANTTPDLQSARLDSGMLDLGDQPPLLGNKRGGILDPEIRARLEQELNPPVEQRLPDQGELDLGHQRQEALTPEETLVRQAPVFDPDAPPTARNLEEGFDRTAPLEQMDLDPRMSQQYEMLPGSQIDRVKAEGREDLTPVRGDLPEIPYEPTTRNPSGGFIGKPQPTKSAWDRFLEWRKANAQNARRGRHGQRGIIDPDLLTLGTAKVFENLRNSLPSIREASAELLRKFEGTFNSESIKKALATQWNPHSEWTIALMSPSDFHRLAYSRSEPYLSSKTADDRRQSIREGLASKAGLDDIPELVISDRRVISHQGRHRMDVFKEQGMDLIPVRIRMANGKGWGKDRVHPEQIMSEDGKQFGKFPESIFFPTEGTKPVTHVRPAPMGRYQRGHIGDWTQDFEKKASSEGTVSALLQAKKELEADTRSIEQLIAEEKLDPNTAEDLAAKRDGLLGRMLTGIEKLGTKLLIDRTIEILARERTGTGKLVKNIVDRRAAIERTKEIGIGTTIKQALEHWKTNPFSKEGKRTRKDLREMLTVWRENVGETPLARENFRNDWQYEAFVKTQDVLNRVIDEVNTMRGALGRQPIPKLNNYLPAIWQGDYRIWIKDGAGKNVAAYAFKNAYQAKWAKKELQKAHPDMLIEDPVHIPEKADYNDFSAFEDALRINSQDFYATRQLHATYQRILQQKGFGAHGMTRQNIMGYLGFEPGHLGVANIQKAIEIYIKRAENHKANIQKAELARQLDTIPDQLQAKLPETMKYLREYLAQARGVDLAGLKPLENLVSEMGEISGFGRSAVDRVIQASSGVASLYWLLTAKFLSATILQPLNAIPKLRQLNIRIPDTENFLSAQWHGYQNLLFPDDTAKRASRWANDNEYLDSTIVSLINLHKNDLSSSGSSAVGNYLRLGLAWSEKKFVRAPVFLAFEHMLRNVVKDDTTRFRYAADLMDYYMVHYDRQSSPLVYNELGTLGEAARPLKQYAHNTWGQFIEYAQNAKNKTEFTPLALFMSNQILVAGIKGMIGFAEATALIYAINNIFGTDWMTPEEWLFTKGESDLMNTLTFGVPSTALGVDLSSSSGAPALPNMFSLPPVGFATDAVAKTANFFYKYATGGMTDKIAMETALAVSPNAMRGMIEELYTEEGMPVPKPTQNMQGTYVRDSGEKVLAAALSLKSIDEARADAQQRAFKSIFQRAVERKISTLDVITDRVVNKQPIPKALLERYIRDGGNLKNLTADIRQKIISRTLPYNDKQLIGPTMTPAKRHRLEIMRDVLDKQQIEREQERPNNPPKHIERMSETQAKQPVESFQKWFDKQPLETQKQILLHLKRRGIVYPMGHDVPDDRIFPEDPNVRKFNIGKFSDQLL